MTNNISPRKAMLLGIATTLGGAGALIARRIHHVRTARALRAVRPVPHRDVPIWAQAAAIVASSASALLLLVRQRA